MANDVRIRASLDDKVTGGLDKIRDRFDTLGKSKGFQSLVMGVGVGAGINAFSLLQSGVSVATDAIFDSVKAASHLNETLSKSSVVFGDSAGEVSAWGDTTAKAFALSKNQAVGAAATFGNLFNQIGVSKPEVAGMSERLVELAGDLSSFNDIDPTEALEKLRSGLAGESEPLRSVGVFLTEAKVKAKALEMGLKSAHGTLSEGDKILARYALILQETSSAQGDFARTANGMENQGRALSAQMDDLSAKLGSRLMPAFMGVQKAALGFVSTLDLVQGGASDNIDTATQQAEAYVDLERAFAFLIPAAGTLADAQEHSIEVQKATAQATKDSTDRIVGDLSRGASSVKTSLGKMGDAAEDWRDRYVDAAGDIARKSHRITTQLIKDAERLRGNVFDETETRAELHDQRMALHAAEDAKSAAKSAEARRQARDDIVQALDDEGASLEDLSSQGKLTKKDVDKFAADVKRNYSSLSADGRKQVDLLLARYRLLAGQKDIVKNFTLNYREKKTTYHAPGHGPTEFGATGGKFAAGTDLVVGEEGWERMKLLPGGGAIVTDHAASKASLASSGGGGGSAGLGGRGVTVNVYAGVGTSFTAAEGRRLADAILPPLVAAMQRTGHLPRTATGLRG